MRKVLIQVVSVITLVFGTCYQSVLALADDRSRTELSGVQLNDSKGNKLHQVKVNETNELEMTVTVNNKDGENAEGEAAMWLPEDQLKVIKDRVEAESAVTDTNATLIFERKNKQPQLHWKNVKTSATFKLKLPVQFTSPMTSMALPIALGSQREYLQPLTAVSADATEEEMKQAGEATQLPANTLQSLISFIDAQKAQQAQQEQQAEPKAPAKDAAKEEAAKEDAEAKRAADKKAEQDVEDLKKEAAKTDDALKKNSKTVTAESKSDGAKRESQSKKETKAGENLGELLKKNTGNKPLDQSIFNTVKLQQGNQTIDLTDDAANVTDLKDFKLIYEWDSKTLLEKLNNNNHNHEIKNGDYYTFKIYGSSSTNGDIGDTPIEAPDGEVYAYWSLKEVPKSDEEKRAYQEITIRFTNEMVNNTNVSFNMNIEQIYKGPEPIEFEFNDNASIEVDPIVTEDLLTKDGEFIGNNKIKWTVTLDTRDKDNGEKMKISDIKLNDKLHAEDQSHSFVDWSEWKIYDDSKDRKEEFKPEKSGDIWTISGTSKEDVNSKQLTFEIITEYKPETFGTFGNGISGSIGDSINLAPVDAHVSSSDLNKKYTGYDAENGHYSWNATILLNLDQFGDQYDDSEKVKEAKRDALRGIVLTDTLKGPHQFDDILLEKLEVRVIPDPYPGKDEQGEEDERDNVTRYFNSAISGENNSSLTLTIDKDISDKDLDELIGLLAKRDKDNPNGSQLSISYQTLEKGQGDPNLISNSMNLKWTGGDYDSGEVTTNQKGQLIKKSGELLRAEDKIYDDDKAHIKWTLTVNELKRKFEKLQVVDVLPDDVKTDDIESIEIDGKKYTLDELVGGKLATTGHADPAKSGGNSLYDFSEEKGGRPNEAIRFEFGSEFSGESITIEITTKHDWQNGDPTNYTGALIGDSFYEYDDYTQPIDERIRNNAFKDGTLQLKDDDPESKNNTVKWSIGIGSRLNTYFGTAANHVDRITIDDVLNV